MTDKTKTFSTEIRELGENVGLLQVTGEIDLSSATTLESQFQVLAKRGLTKVIVDASEVTFMDSTGVHALIKGKRAIHETGSAIFLVCSPPVRRVLELISPEPLFATARLDTIAEALARVNTEETKT